MRPTKSKMWWKLAAVPALLAGCLTGEFGDDYKPLHCTGDADCPTGRCLRDQAGSSCKSAEQAACATSACAPGTICSDGTCRTVCEGAGALSCLNGQACKGAVCVGDDPVHDPSGGGAGGGGAAGSGGAGASASGTSGAGGSGGSSGSSGASGTGGTANPCSDAADCQKCCDPGGSGMAAWANLFVATCGCGSQALCTSECSLNCEVSVALQSSCVTCLNSIPDTATCKVMAFSQCDAKSPCSNYRACVTAAQCK